MFSHPQFQVASQLLIGLMFQGPSRQLGDRVEDVRHALEVSAELIRQWEEDQPGSFAHQMGKRLQRYTLSPAKPILRFRGAKMATSSPSSSSLGLSVPLSLFQTRGLVATMCSSTRPMASRSFDHSCSV